MTDGVTHRLIVDVHQVVIDSRLESRDELRNQNDIAVVCTLLFVKSGDLLLIVLTFVRD